MTTFNDLFDMQWDNMREVNLTQAINTAMIMIALVEKGLVDNEEMRRAHALATHLVEQEYARQKDDARKQMEEECPGVDRFLKKFMGM